jgi:hypothetical protein
VAIPKLVAAMLAMLIISSTVQAAEIKLIQCPQRGGA